MKKKQRLRRRFMFFTYILLCVIAILFLMFATTASKETEKVYFEYYVSSGDTLWKIAEEYGPSDMDIREFICEIEEANNIQGGIYEGRKILIPEI